MMNKLTWGACAVLVAAAWGWRASAQQAYAPPSAGFGSRELVTHFEEQAAGPTVLTVVEPQSRVVAVYHIARDTGAVKLKSVRNFDLDLRLADYNSGDPKPEEIRKMFELQQ
jgi:hypothetical protein